MEIENIDKYFKKFCFNIYKLLSNNKKVVNVKKI